MSDRELCAAIGWLSREDKIQVENCHDGKELFFLICKSIINYMVR